jgi:hypothetical protein
LLRLNFSNSFREKLGMEEMHQNQAPLENRLLEIEETGIFKAQVPWVLLANIQLFPGCLVPDLKYLLTV